jgi:hypothetical protein
VFPLGGELHPAISVNLQRPLIGNGRRRTEEKRRRKRRRRVSGGKLSTEGQK